MVSPFFPSEGDLKGPVFLARPFFVIKEITGRDNRKRNNYPKKLFQGETEMQKSQQLVFLIMIIILAVAFFTFILTYSLLPPKEQVPRRSRVVIHPAAVYNLQAGGYLPADFYIHC